jgi:AcrR family transcriptional regulator
MAVRRLTRAQSAARTRRRLLAAAQRVFFERGFHGASLEAVAEEAGLTKGAVYSRFESKADLFLAFQEERNRENVQRFTEQFHELGPGDRPVDLFINYWRQKLLHDPPEYTLLVIEFWASACRDPEIHRRFSEQHELIIVAAAELLDEAATRLGAVLPLAALELTRLSTAIAHGLALEQLLNREKIDREMIELAFAPLHELYVSGSPDGQIRSDRGSAKGGSDDGTRRARGRSQAGRATQS